MGRSCDDEGGDGNDEDDEGGDGVEKMGVGCRSGPRPQSAYGILPRSSDHPTWTDRNIPNLAGVYVRSRSTLSYISSDLTTLFAQSLAHLLLRVRCVSIVQIHSYSNDLARLVLQKLLES